METSFGFVGKDFTILGADANASFRVFNLKANILCSYNLIDH